MSNDFNVKVYIILQTALGKLDLLLADTIYSIHEIRYDTKDLNYYRYQEE